MQYTRVDNNLITFFDILKVIKYKEDILMAVKYVFVTGGVVSGLGKGITAASLGRLLKMRRSIYQY